MVAIALPPCRQSRNRAGRRAQLHGQELPAGDAAALGTEPGAGDKTLKSER
jgi:hypothetical protein